MTGSSRSLDRRRKSLPSYRFHKPTGKAVVTIGARDHYLGPYGSEESRRQYGALIAQHAGGVAVDPLKSEVPGKPSGNSLTINELVLAFMRHADQHYRKNGEVTSEIHCVQMATRSLVKLYGFTTADEFGPLALKAVRETMIDAKWVRYSINKAIGRIRGIFRWAVENELVNAVTLQKLTAVAPLLAGRSKARDNPPRQPATKEQIEAVQPLVSPLVRDLIDVQRFTGARAGELLKLTGGMIDTTGEVWLFNVEGHKTEHHGHARIIAIGPQSQAILKRRMAGLSPTDHIFPIRRDSYTLAVHRACKQLVERSKSLKSQFKPWSPHQLRHAAGHEIREAFGLEHVQATLGHASFAMSERYAQASLQKAIEVAERVG